VAALMRNKLGRWSLALIAAVLLSLAAPADAETLPDFVQPPRMTYPSALLKLAVEGSVGVGVLIGRDGSAKCVWIVHSSGHVAFDEAAVAALSRAKWVALADELEVVIPVNFRIEPSTAPPPPGMKPQVRGPGEPPWSPCSKTTS
jgi:TonB family protein